MQQQRPARLIKGKPGERRQTSAQPLSAPLPLPLLKPLAACIRKATLPAAGLLLGLNAGTIFAAPQGGQVVGGQGNITTPNATTTTINQQSQNLAIDWTSFNIARHELVQFNQPSASASALNRIYDQNPSQIQGALRANGNVLLVNPNGVFFGPTASVKVGSLVASGLNITTEDFMAGNYHFQTPAGGEGGLIINQGILAAATGGSVALVGGAVRNEGVILATAGQVTLAAGKTMTMDFDGDGLIQFTVDEEVLQNAHVLDDAVSNSGAIHAAGGSVLLTGKAAKDVFTHVVNNEGVIRAGRIENQGGTIRLIAAGNSNSLINTGTLDAAGQGGDGGTVELSSTDTTIVAGQGSIDASSIDAGGGTIQLLGDKVGLFDTATIDASGATGGGTVLIGGDYQGSNPDIQNATVTYVGEDASIKADATSNGAGGKVVVWADDTTRFYGTATALGGKESGDGGLIETSGKRSLDVSGSRTDASAFNGEAGTWLLDPVSVTITTAATLNGVFGGLNPDIFTPGATGALINNTDIENRLNGVVGAGGASGTNVTITTDDGGVLAEAGDVTQAAGATISHTANTNVTLRIDAAGTINISENITSTTGTLNVDLNANDNSGTQNDPNTAVGDVIISATVNTNGGTFDSSGVNFNSTAGTITTGAGIVTITHTGTVDLGAITTSGASISATAGGLLTVQQAINSGTGVLNIDLTGVGVDLSMATSDISHGTGASQIRIDAGTGNFNMAAGASIISSEGDVLIAADTVSLDATSSVQTPQVNSGIAIAPSTVSQAINLGAGATTGFALTDVELNTLDSNVYQIGSSAAGFPFTGATTGNITLVGNWTPDFAANNPFIRLFTTGAIADSGIAALDLGTSSVDLVLGFASSVTFDNAGHDFVTIATQGNPGTININDGVGSMTVGTV
ncbi:MAG: filamentous hemagglutinin N-terminal domain-containing protein, partial [Gammaproteobacteria bacterium]